MKNRVLIKRYAEGLAAALKTDAEYAAVGREVAEFAGLMEHRNDLRNALCRPFLSSAGKTAIIDDLFDALACQVKTRRFIELIVKHGRLELLPDISRVLPGLWKERQGIVPLEVKSAIPLDETQKRSLEARLREVERRDVFCTYAVDPGIIGGLTVRKGNMIYDVSLKGQLERLKYQIRER